MDPQQTIGLLVLASYFLLIFVLLYIICASFLPLNVPRNGPNYRAYTFTVLTLSSFAHTWYCESQFCQQLHVLIGFERIIDMFAFMGVSLTNHHQRHRP